MSKHIDLIDIAKGISILLVAFAHSELSKLLPTFNDATMLIRLPLFFFLSGIFFSLSARPLPYIAGKTDALLKPYFVTLFLLVLTTILLGNGQDAWQELKGIFYGVGHTIRWGPLWFLTHLWSLFVVAYFVMYHTKLPTRSNFAKTLFVILLFVVGSFTLDIFWKKSVSIFGNDFVLPGLPFSIDIIFLSMAFFISGSFLSQRVKNFKPRIAILLITAFIFITIFINTEVVIHFYSRRYHEPLFATIAAFSGIYIVLSLSYYISKNKLITIFFTTFGSASLFILIFHAPLGMKTYKLFNNLFDFQSLNAILSFFVSIIVPLLIKQFVQKSEFLMLFYFPLKSNNLFQKMHKKYMRKA